MRILILNWRCPANPRAGGAEFLTFEIARRLVTYGHSVEWFSASFPGAAPVEELDGVRIVRSGRQWTVHIRACLRYWRSLKGRFDVVIDEINTVPFLAPLWARIPVFAMIFQLARDVWWYEAPPGLNAIGYAVEPFYLQAYRDSTVFTISKSTHDDLRRLGLKGRIEVIPIGTEPVSTAKPEKSQTPTFLYVGRLSPSKRVEHLMEALRQFRLLKGAGRLWLVGDGGDKYKKYLAAMAVKLEVADHIVFWGRVSAADKYRLMASADALLMASVREGWGLVVTEANSHGVPAIVYDVPGLRDSVHDGVTGLVVAQNPAALMRGMLRLMDDPKLYSQLAGEAERRSRLLSLDGPAVIINEALTQAGIRC